MLIQNSIEELTVLKSSPFHDFCSSQAQSCVPAVTRVLGRLRCGKGINCPNPSEFMRKAPHLIVRMTVLRMSMPT